jgi:hypothetical protein
MYKLKMPFKIICLAIVSVLAGTAVTDLCAVETKHSTATKSSPKINPISYAKSNSYIHLNSAFDLKGNIHLLWMVGDSNFVYQRSSDLGKSWTHPKPLAYDDPAILKYPMLAGIHNHPKIIAAGNMLTVLWTFDSDIENYDGNENGEAAWNYNGGFIIRTSSDEGATWSPEQKVYVGSTVLDYAYAVQGDTVYIAYHGEAEYRGGKSNGEGTYFSKSTDYGLNWDKPVSISPDIKDIDYLLSIAITGQTIHVVGKAEDQMDSRGVGTTGFWYIKGRNLGQNWEGPKRFDFGQKDGVGASIGDLKIMPYGNNLLLTLATNDVYYLFSKDDGASWTKPKEAGATLDMPIHDACATDDKANIFWIDRRHKKMDWEGRMPGAISAMLLWDRSPNWANNDLYYARLEDGHVIGKMRLTPPMSYVSDITCGQVSGNTIVIWSGKREVGKSVEDSPAPFEIFYYIIEK